MNHDWTVKLQSLEKFIPTRSGEPTQNAVLYNITIIGEAVKKLTPEFREQNSHIPWRQIAGMRDKLIHDYRQINIHQVWLVTQIDIPELLKNLQPLLPEKETKP